MLSRGWKAPRRVTLLAGITTCVMAAGATSALASRANVSTQGPTATAASKHLTLGFVTGLDQDVSYASAYCGAKTAAKQLGNISIKFYGTPSPNATAEVPILNSVLSTKPDGLIVVPSDPQGMQGALNTVVKDGVKLVVADTEPKAPIGLTFIGPSNLEGGEMAAQYLAQKMHHKGTVFIDSYMPGTSPEDRVVGFEKYMKAHDPKVKILPVQFSNAIETTAAQQTSAALAANPDISGLFGQNESTALGMVTALRNAGKLGKIPFVAYDADENEARLLKSGAFDALVSQGFYYEGYEGVELLAKTLRGQMKAGKIKPTTGTDLKVLTAANVNSAASKPFIYKAC